MKVAILVTLSICGTNDIRMYDPRISNFIQSSTIALIKADVKGYIPLETTTIFFLANIFLKQGISSEYVMVDFIFLG